MRYTHMHMHYYFISILQAFYNHQILTVLIKIPKAETKSLARPVGAGLIGIRSSLVTGKPLQSPRLRLE